MIAPLNLPVRPLHVPQSGLQVMRLMDSFRSDAATELAHALAGISGKAIGRANVAGAGVTYLSRATNGGDCNPLYRLASVLVMLKRLGMGRERAQRMVDWFQALVDLIWGDEAPDFDEAMEKETDLDAADEPHQMRAVRGDADALRAWIAVKRESRAFDAVAIRAATHRLAEMEAEG